MKSAVVFAYHDVGVRCLSVLLAHGVHVSLVVTHEDDPGENIWFGSVKRLAELHGITAVTPEDPNKGGLAAQVEALKPDFLFSFYYRFMLGERFLAAPRHGALNMHGSLLPKFRGRVPVNWAIIHGERQTGASLHYMETKPDAGDLVDQQAVPILPDDTAGQVFAKVTVAAEQVLDRSLPALLLGSAPRKRLDLRAGSYYGRRRPEDGRIDWSRPAWSVHNLIRAVAPPYPGAYSALAGKPLKLLASHYPDQPAKHGQPTLYAEGGRCYADCGDGKRIEILQLEWDGRTMDAAEFAARHAASTLGE
ncbi:MAG TPA: formyltransferase [Gammaproteobacteria bacterium]|nr:formyltransferase [Gammaproteobacteria bacterium]